MVVLWRNTLQQLPLPQACSQDPTESRIQSKLHGSIDLPRINASHRFKVLHLLLELLTILAVAYYTVYNDYELLVAFIFPVDLYTIIFPPSSKTFAMAEVYSRSHKLSQQQQTFLGTLIHDPYPCDLVQCPSIAPTSQADEESCFVA